MSFRDNVALYAVTTVTMETSIQQDLVQHIQSLKQKVNAPPPPPDAAISTRLIKPLPRQEPIASTSKLPVEKRKKGSTSNSTLSPIVPQKRQSEEADSTRSRGFEGGTVKGKERARE